MTHPQTPERGPYGRLCDEARQLLSGRRWYVYQETRGPGYTTTVKRCESLGIGMITRTWDGPIGKRKTQFVIDGCDTEFDSIHDWAAELLRRQPPQQPTTPQPPAMLFDDATGGESYYRQGG